MNTNPDAANNNLKFEIIIDDQREYVNEKMMMLQSGLFSRRYIEYQSGQQKGYSLNFSDIKNKGRNLKQYFNIFRGQPANLEISDLYSLLLIAEEWESPEIVTQLKLFLQANTSAQELLAKFAFDINAKLEVAQSLVDLVSSKCRDIYQSPTFLNLPPNYLCMILSNPNCALPRRDLFDKLILQLIEKHEYKCASLVNKIDFLSTEYETLTELNALLNKIKLSEMYPNVKRVLFLRTCEIEKNKLEVKISALEKENKALKEKVNISESLVRQLHVLKSHQ
ncbi:hypothetical protein TRFO_22697 [Tritrichomonas foetus]|uniref:BTB domain-containing protein n=1 Tax=Tritrichomonas foetus TaxID=1144522 RepID=A0A1J4KHH0_9EUKA|nr:hypothetical protein TRFO_22697 [Tritrichomonas foetus]|eukprot:OHT08773.1 hypothetical protein TRFO_22697 [Tritrichomonas foetus]